jgi:hypothetical protein
MQQGRKSSGGQGLPDRAAEEQATTRGRKRVRKGFQGRIFLRACFRFCPGTAYIVNERDYFLPFSHGHWWAGDEGSRTRGHSLGWEMNASRGRECEKRGRMAGLRIPDTQRDAGGSRCRMRSAAAVGSRLRVLAKGRGREMESPWRAGRWEGREGFESFTDMENPREICETLPLEGLGAISPPDPHRA